MNQKTIHRTTLSGFRRWGLLALLAGGLAACGGEPTSSVTASSSGGPVDLGDFPIPAPPGGDVGRVIHEDARMITYPASELAAITEFYDAWLAESDFEGVGGAPKMITYEASGQVTTLAFNGDEAYTIIATPDGAEVYLALRIQRKE